MKHGHAAEVPRPASEMHRTHKWIRLWCDAVYVAAAVVGHGWMQEMRDWTRPNKWTRASKRGPTNYFIIYLKKAYLKWKPFLHVFSLLQANLHCCSPPLFPPLQVGPSFFSEFSHLLHVAACVFLASVSPFAACYFWFCCFWFLSRLCFFPVDACLVLWFMISLKCFCASIVPHLFPLSKIPILSLSLFMCSG